VSRSINLKKNSTIVLYFPGVIVAKESLSAIRLIFGRWIENSTSLLLTANMGDLSVSGKFSTIAIGSESVSLRSVDGDVNLSIPLNAPETVFWYWEPREISDRPEYAEEYERLFGSVPESAQFSPTIGAKFSVRVTAPGLSDLLTEVGKVVLIEWIES
jgi:hypothetical protein